MAYEVFDNYLLTLPQTTLNGGITSGATSLTVTDASSFRTIGNFRIRIDNELIIVGSVSGNTFNNLTRGAENTSAAAHSNGAGVNALLTRGAVEQVQQASPQFTNTSSAVYTIDSTNAGLPDVEIWHGRSGNTSYVLPSPTQGRRIYLNDDTGAIQTPANWVSIVPNAGETINGSSGFALTGTSYNFTNGSANVSATGSKFTQELYVGASIVSSNQAGVNYIVQSITDDTHLVLRTTFSGTTTTTATATRTSLLFAANFANLTIKSDSTNWLIKGDGTPTTISFTASGTFIWPAGVTSARARGYGGGGGGGGGLGGNSGASNVNGTGGGGGGGATEQSIEVTGTGNTADAVTIGAGGAAGTGGAAGAGIGTHGAGGQTSTFGSKAQFLGGSGGAVGSALSANFFSAGGVPWTTDLLTTNTDTSKNLFVPNGVQLDVQGNVRGQFALDASATAAFTGTDDGTGHPSQGAGGYPGSGGQGGVSASASTTFGAGLNGNGGQLRGNSTGGGGGGVGGPGVTNAGGTGGGGGGAGPNGQGGGGGGGAGGTSSTTHGTNGSAGAGGTGATGGTTGAANVGGAGGTGGTAGPNTGAGGGGGGAGGNGNTTGGVGGPGGAGGSGRIDLTYVL